MRVVVFGATGGTGREVVTQAMARGHQVTAFVRDPSTMALEDETIPVANRLRIVTGDVFDYPAVNQAVKGQEAVICSLGSKSLAKTTVRAQGTANIAKAMAEEQVARLLLVSAMGIGESWSDLSFINKLFFATLLWSSRQDHEAQEAVVKGSGLDWTILRPSGLIDGQCTGDYALGENIEAESSRIARADVAHAIIKELDENALVGTSVTITN